jgi:Cu(I)/Ag(I) efflux system membrane protein CusA/SilA
MELTGIKTPLGIKVQGPDVDGIERLAGQIQSLLATMPQQRSIFSERISQGYYVNVEVNRDEAARYGLSVEDVQTAVASGIGGRNIAENIEGRERYPINVRYEQDFRNSLDRMRAVLIGTPSGYQIPLGQVARVSFSPGPAMIRDEDGQLTGYTYINLKDNNYGAFVDAANRLLKSKLALPANYSFSWAGEFQYEQRAKQRLNLIVPVVFVLIFLLLYMVFKSVVEVVVLIVPTFYAMTGGLLVQWLLGYNFSVAVWVGYIALFGIAVETGVVMVVYLHEALERHLAAGEIQSAADIELAVIEGAVQRLRPKLMTVFAVLLSLVPILWATGVGSDVMKPIAAPIVGGMITSSIHVLILVPVFFAMMKDRALRSGKLRAAPEIDV